MREQVLRADDSWPFAKEESFVLVSVWAQFQPGNFAQSKRFGKDKVTYSQNIYVLNDRTVREAPLIVKISNRNFDNHG